MTWPCKPRIWTPKSSRLYAYIYALGTMRVERRGGEAVCTRRAKSVRVGVNPHRGWLARCQRAWADRLTSWQRAGPRPPDTSLSAEPPLSRNSFALVSCLLSPFPSFRCPRSSVILLRVDRTNSCCCCCCCCCCCVLASLSASSSNSRGVQELHWFKMSESETIGENSDLYLWKIRQLFLSFADSGTNLINLIASRMTKISDCR